MEVKVNNINLYYEEYGSGQPIILLHGNQETHEIFDKLINKLKFLRKRKKPKNVNQ